VILLLMVWTVTLAIIVQQIAMIVNATSSSGDHTSELQRMTADVARLSGAVDWWNSAIVVMMVLAALAATGLVVTQFIAFRRASQLASAQGLLQREKERESNEAVASLNQSAEQLKNDNLKLEEKLAQQGHRDAMLLASQNEFAARLNRFAGQKFEIGLCPEFKNDWEVYSFKTVLSFTLGTKADWITEPERDIYVCTAGVGIFARSTAPPMTREAAQELSLALDELLGKYQIGSSPASQVGFALTVSPKPPAELGEESSADDTILIVVGAHP
jgi:hypothetical protein